ncbi:MAG TPA: helix-turn-helix domain-containing protein [Anaerolineae bacterium]|nr:helix-turn-helix domain-containing protein [Anaerolineae bacterium]
MNYPIVSLQQLGFSEYEARAYTVLLQRSPLNGYELAKLSGLPRANIYGVLQKLEERGAVIRLDVPGGVQYAPLPAEELIQRLRSQFQESLDTAQQALNEISSPAEYEYVGNTRGYPALLEHARALLSTAQERVLLAIWPQEALNLAKPLAQAEARGVKITTLCMAACPQECGGCRGQIYRYQVAPEQQHRWLVVVPDRAEVLTGEIGPGEETLAVRTRQRLLVELATWYIRHSIALAAVVGDLGSRLGELLKAETRSILASLKVNGRQEGWLEHMIRLVGGESNKTTSEADDFFNSEKIVP